MGTWDFRQLQQNLDANKIPKLLFIFGEEEYLISESLGLIKNKILAEAAVDFNYDQFFVGEGTMDKVVDTVEMLPMMSDRRLVILRGVEKVKEKEWEILMPLIDNPVDSTCFVLVTAKVDKRKKYFKKIQKEGQPVEFKRPYENQMPAWIDYIAFQNNLRIGREEQSLLFQLVGNNLTDINSELKKLKQFVGDREKVTSEDLLKVISQVRVDSVFDLTDAIGRKDRIMALTYLANLLDHGQNEIGTMSLVLRHVRILENLKMGIKEGLRGAKLCSKVGVPSFFLQKYLNQVNGWSDPQIKKTIDALKETDKALKSSPVSSHIWLENFVLKTCR